MVLMINKISRHFFLLTLFTLSFLVVTGTRAADSSLHFRRLVVLPVGTIEEMDIALEVHSLVDSRVMRQLDNIAYFCFSLSRSSRQATPDELTHKPQRGSPTSLDGQPVRARSVPQEEQQETIRIHDLVVSYFGSFQDGEIVLGLDELMLHALQHNRALRAVRHKLEQNLGQLQQARSGYMPHLSLEASYRYLSRRDSADEESNDDLEDESAQTVLEIADIDEGDVAHGSVHLTQLLYDFGKTSGAIDISRFNVKAADARLVRKVQQTMYLVQDAYYAVLENRRLVDISMDTLKSFSQHLEKAKAYHKAGVRTRIDVIKAEVEVSNAKMDVLRAKSNLKSARVALEQILGGVPNGGRYTLYSDELYFQTLLDHMPGVPESLENLIQLALKKRPDILQLQRLVEAAEANLSRVKGDYLPSVVAEAKYTGYETDLSSYKDSWEVGVALSWELFSGFRTTGAMAEARGKLREATAQLQELQLKIVQEVTESYLRSHENRAGVKIALETLDLARENLQLAEKRYHSGAYDVIEFNDAQISLTQTQNELVVAYYSYLTALAGIDHATGTLTAVADK